MSVVGLFRAWGLESWVQGLRFRGDARMSPCPSGGDESGRGLLVQFFLCSMSSRSLYSRTPLSGLPCDHSNRSRRRLHGRGVGNGVGGGVC